MVIWLFISHHIPIIHDPYCSYPLEIQTIFHVIFLDFTQHLLPSIIPYGWQPRDGATYLWCLEQPWLFSCNQTMEHAPNPQWVRWCSYQNTIYIMLYLHSWILSWFKSIDIHLYHNLSLFLVDFWPCKHRLHATFRRRAPSAVPWSSGAGSIGSTWWEIWIEQAGPGKKKQGFDVIIFSGFNWLIYGLYMVNIWLIYGEWGLIIIWLVVEPPL